MKYVLKSLVVAGALIGSSTSNAFHCVHFHCLPTYVGAEYQWITTGHRKSDVTGTTFGKSFCGTHLYVGQRWKNVSVETGYEFTRKKVRHTNFTIHHPELNHVTASVKARNRLAGMYMDVNGYIPIPALDGFELIGSIGVARIKHQLLADITLNVEGNPVFKEDLSRLTKYRGVFRLGAGAQYALNDYVNIRGMVRWKAINLGSKIRSEVLGVQETVRHRDVVCLSAGLFFKF